MVFPAFTRRIKNIEEEGFLVTLNKQAQALRGTFMEREKSFTYFFECFGPFENLKPTLKPLNQRIEMKIEL